MPERILVTERAIDSDEGAEEQTILLAALVSFTPILVGLYCHHPYQPRQS